VIRQRLKELLKPLLPGDLRRWLRKTQVRATETPPYRFVRFGSFRRVTPIHAGFRTGRGKYIDRYYIERFLQEHSGDVKGRVLELSSDEDTVRFGGAKVTHSDVLDIRPDHPAATIIADLTAPDGIPANTFDCVILTQTLNFIYDVPAAIRTVYRILKPGGVVLVSVAGISQIAPEEAEYCGDFWRFTSFSLRRRFEEVFPAENLHVESHGNVLAAISFLHGLAVEELTPAELDHRDPGFELSILLRAVKPAAAPLMADGR
jgi:SAM-dependent methyltransferase